MFFLWIRKQVRKVMEPIPLEKAQVYSNVFTCAYLLTGWTLFGMTIYHLFGDKKKRAPIFYREGGDAIPSSGPYYGRIFRADNMKIFSVQGFSLKKDGEYRYDEDSEAQEDSKEFYGDEVLPQN